MSSEETREVRDILDNPERLVDKVYSNIPGILFFGVFAAVWLSLFVTLRNSPIWRYRVLYPYTLKELINFKVPEYLIWLLIVGLVLFVGSDHGLGAMAEVAGTNILVCLSVLYFFQGFGVYNDFMTFLRIRGFLRIIFTAFTVLYTWKILVGVGIFDLWFNFRKFFKKQNGEGDKI